MLQHTLTLHHAGVTESQIAEWVVNGTDPYQLGTNRSVYRCALQFVKRVEMAEMLLGGSPLPSGTTCKDVVETLSCNPTVAA